MTNELTYEQEIVRSVFGAYINDLKAYSSKPDRPTLRKLEEIRDKAIKALEQQPSEDCIRRQAVRELICQNNDYYGYSERFHEFTEKCLQLPPVIPQRPKGKWIKVYSGCRDCHIFYYKCSSCEYTTAYNPNYCCDCGSYNPETVIDEDAEEWAKQLWNMEQCGNGGRP